MTRPERLKVGTRDAIAVEVAEHIAEVAQAAFAARGVFTLAIAGGSVADAVLPVLANAALPWPAVHIFWCDERAVPLTHRDSNAGAAFALWKGSRLAAEAVLHPMPAHEPGLERAAVGYSAEIAAVAGKPAILDVVLLGVGEDGHVASLFPHHRELSMTGDAALAVSDSPKPPKRRLTLALEVITGARETIIVAFGAGKAQAMRQALGGAASQLPVSLVIQRGKNVHVFLDAEAASALPEHQRQMV